MKIRLKTFFGVMGASNAHYCNYLTDAKHAENTLNNRPKMLYVDE